MKKLSILFAVIAVLLSDAMCFAVAYNYRGLMCGIEHAGFSAPAGIAFIIAIPFLICIAVCVILSTIFYKKSK